MEKVKIRKVKSPLKKYKKIIDEFQEIEYEKINDVDFDVRYKEQGIAIINQLVIDNGLDKDLVCDVFGCDASSYAKFFLNSADDVSYEYILNEFCVLFRCNHMDLHKPHSKNITFVPKWANTYWKMKCYMKYNKLLNVLNHIWGFDNELM